jgi:hypothetical protein
MGYLVVGEEIRQSRISSPTTDTKSYPVTELAEVKLYFGNWFSCRFQISET